MTNITRKDIEHYAQALFEQLNNNTSETKKQKYINFLCTNCKVLLSKAYITNDDLVILESARERYVHMPIELMEEYVHIVCFYVANEYLIKQEKKGKVSVQSIEPVISSKVDNIILPSKTTS